MPSKILSFARKMLGASAGAAGRSGYVPAPAAGDQAKFLRADATWQNIPGGGDLLAANALGEFNTQALRKGVRANLDAAAIDEIVSGIIAHVGWVPFTGQANDRVTSQPIGSNVGKGDVTLICELEVPTANPSGNQGIIGMGPTSTHAGGNNSLRAYFTSAGAIVVRIVSTSGANTDLTVASVITDFAGEKVRLAIVRSATTITAYLNRRQVGTATASAWSDPINSAYFHLGVGGSVSEVFSGKISQAWRFNYAKPATGDFSIERFAKVGLANGDRYARFRARILSRPRNGDFTETATDWAAVATGTATLDTTDDELDVIVAAANDGAKLSAANLGQLIAGNLHYLEVELKNLNTVTTVAFKFGALAIGAATANGRYRFEFRPPTGVDDLTVTGDVAGSFSITKARIMGIEGGLLNGSFETAGAGGADVFANWTESVAGTSAIADETSEIYFKGHAAKFTIDGSNSNASLSQAVCIVGKRYRYSVWAKADSGTPTVTIGGNSHTLSDTWAEYTGTFVATSSSFTIARNSAASRTLYFDGAFLEEIGCDLALTPWGLDKATKLWLDESANHYDATLFGTLAPVTNNNRVTEESERKTGQSTGALVFDGAAAGAKATATLTGQNIATGDVSLWSRFRIPATNPPVSGGIITLASSPTTSAGNALSLILVSTGALRVQLSGATTADVRQAEVPNFAATYGGRLVDVFVVLNRFTGGISLLVNGRNTPFIELSAGTPPSWAGSITSAYCNLGIYGSGNLFSGEIHRAAAFNCALTPAQVDYIAQTGGRPPELQSGSSTPKYSSTFGAGDADSWSGVSGAAVSGIAGPVQGVSDVLEVDSGAGTTCRANTSGFNITFGRYYRLKFKVHRPAANATGTHLHIETSAGNTVNGSGFTGVALAGDAWASHELYFIGTDANLRFGLRTSGGSATITAGDKFHLDDVILEELGPLCYFRCNSGIGFQETDISGNRSHATLSGSGVTHKIERRDGKLRFTISASGNTQVFGQSCLPANARINFATAKGANSVTSSLGSTSGATDIVNGASVTTARSDLTLAGRFPSGQNLWVNHSGAVAADYEVDYSVCD